MNRHEINKVKKHLGITKQELILLHTYIKYQAEFDTMDDAVEFVLWKITEEEEILNEPTIEEFSSEFPRDGEQLLKDFMAPPTEQELKETEEYENALLKTKDEIIDEVVKEFHEEKTIKGTKLRKGYILKYCLECGYIKQVDKTLDRKKCANFKCRKLTFITVDLDNIDNFYKEVDSYNIIQREED